MLKINIFISSILFVLIGIQFSCGNQYSIKKELKSVSPTTITEDEYKLICKVDNGILLKIKNTAIKKRYYQITDTSAVFNENDSITVCKMRINMIEDSYGNQYHILENYTTVVEQNYITRKNEKNEFEIFNGFITNKAVDKKLLTSNLIKDSVVVELYSVPQVMGKESQVAYKVKQVLNDSNLTFLTDCYLLFTSDLNDYYDYLKNKTSFYLCGKIYYTRTTIDFGSPVEFIGYTFLPKGGPLPK